MQNEKLDVFSPVNNWLGYIYTHTQRNVISGYLKNSFSEPWRSNEVHLLLKIAASSEQCSLWTFCFARIREKVGA